jgi:hypothetical protein
MKATFIEARGFTRALLEYLSDEAYTALQLQLMAMPDSGTVIPKCGGLRKLRIADPGRRTGKRGGARVIYLHVPEASRFFMLHIYGKDQKGDLSMDEKKGLASMAAALKRQATKNISKHTKN